MSKYSSRGVVVALVALLISAFVVSGCDKKPAAPADEASAQAPAAVDEAKSGEHADEHAHEHEAAKPGQVVTRLEDLPSGTNVVQYEMQLLNEAMIGIFAMIMNNQLEGIPASIQKVHGAYELTDKALEQGLYKPPKNSDDLEGFVKVDDEFHDKLRALIKASKANDLPQTTEKFADIVQGCTDCHTKYRF